MSARSIWATPLLRWAGSKRKVIPTLLQCCPHEFTRYIEPFAGSACLFFALRPRRALLGDINAALIETYTTIRNHPRKVARLSASFPHSAAHYYRIRATPRTSLDEITRAAQFVYLNRFCFNGVYRTNRAGIFNVPYGVRTGRLPAEPAFYRCSVALRVAQLRATDFEACLKDVRRGDFIYLDPPYSSSPRPRYGEYGYDSFQPIEIERLASLLESIDRSGCRFLLSYAHAPEAVARFSLWERRTLSVRRHVAGFSKHRSVVTEMLIANYALPSE